MSTNALIRRQTLTNIMVRTNVIYDDSIHHKRRQTLNLNRKSTLITSQARYHSLTHTIADTNRTVQEKTTKTNT